MPYITGTDRNQLMFCSLDSFVDPESVARLIDAFVDSLDMLELGIKEASVEGRPAYDPKSNNISSLKKIFHEFNRCISGAVEWGFTSIDGSKFQTNNSKDNNFTKNKLDSRIGRDSDNLLY